MVVVMLSWMTDFIYHQTVDKRTLASANRPAYTNGNGRGAIQRDTAQGMHVPYPSLAARSKKRAKPGYLIHHLVSGLRLGCKCDRKQGLGKKKKKKTRRNHVVSVVGCASASAFWYLSRNTQNTPEYIFERGNAKKCTK